jgi:hypothetical protein
LVIGASMIGWVDTGSDLMKPVSTWTSSLASTNGEPGSRLKVNSAARSGLSEPPVPLFSGSPVWSMKSSMTRKKVWPS